MFQLMNLFLKPFQEYVTTGETSHKADHICILTLGGKLRLHIQIFGSKS